MEVHHPHHPTHKKKWSEYIIEFVMLFAAVTLGFFAENIREHIAENNKKKELLESVALNFKKDMKSIEFHKEFNEYRRTRDLGTTRLYRGQDLECYRQKLSHWQVYIINDLRKI